MARTSKQDYALHQLVRYAALIATTTGSGLVMTNWNCKDAHVCKVQLARASWNKVVKRARAITGLNIAMCYGRRESMPGRYYKDDRPSFYVGPRAGFHDVLRHGGSNRRGYVVDEGRVLCVYGDTIVTFKPGAYSCREHHRDDVVDADSIYDAVLT